MLLGDLSSAARHWLREATTNRRSLVTNQESRITNRLWHFPICFPDVARTNTRPKGPCSRPGCWRSSWRDSAAVREPVLLDLGPVVGSNVTFFREEVSCKICLEDLPKDIESACHRGQARSARVLLRHALSIRQRDDRRDSVLGHLRLSGPAVRGTSRAPAEARPSARGAATGLFQHR